MRAAQRPYALDGESVNMTVAGAEVSTKSRKLITPDQKAVFDRKQP